MEVDVKGKVVAILAKKNGTTKSGKDWESQEYVLETETNNPEYPRHFVFNVFGGDKIVQFDIKMGEELAVTAEIDAKEYNNRWYNQVTAYKVYHSNKAQHPIQSINPKRNEAPKVKNDDSDDMPF